MKTKLFNNLDVDVELSSDGEVWGYSNAISDNLCFDNVLIKGLSVEDYLKPEIQDFMEEWLRELKEYKTTRHNERI